MESVDGRVILFIIVGGVLFLLGRRVQLMAMMWQSWKDAVKAVPARRKVAFGSVRHVLKLALVAALVLWAVVHVGRFM
ncbi:hypothetical protein [Nonomuraea sp. B19D2]|uniref:hypothetical protein n=1 Tax=Nonomuraea sp. B19D2 TaxID=3159561 RepID=UPI0032DBD3E2